MTTTRIFTARQQECLAHLEQAQQQGLSLQEYARRTDIKVSTLYTARKWLSKARSQTVAPSVNFTEIRTTGVGLAEPCVLHLAPGIRLQLSALPSPQWLAAVCAQWGSCS